MEHSVRLQIMSVLVANESYDFNSMKEVLGITDGALATHVRVLEKEKYITVAKSFIDRKPNTRFKATEKGKKVFKIHLDGLEQLIRQQKK
ncbi:MAG: transcriptional regulator [Cyclobacteriaceae bacterium]